MPKMVLLLLMSLAFRNATVAQPPAGLNPASGAAVINCDTFTVSGYVICLAKRNAATGRFDTWFGFLSDSTKRGDKRIDRSIDAVLELQRRSLRGERALRNISPDGFDILEQGMETALSYDKLSVVMGLHGNCPQLYDFFFRNVLSDSADKEAKFRLPFIGSYCWLSSKEVDTLAPMVSVQFLTMICVERVSPRFEEYTSEFYAYGHPSSFCAGFFQFVQTLMPISASRRKDGYYVLYPVLVR